MSYKNIKSNKFSIQFLFIMLLFLIIVILSSMVILLGKDIYKSINEDRQSNYEIRVSLSYIENKIRQSDKENAVEIKKIQGQPALLIKENYDGINYETWIYYYNKSLNEILIEEHDEFQLQDGMKIVDLDGFNITEISKNTFKIYVESKDIKSELTLYKNSK